MRPPAGLVRRDDETRALQPWPDAVCPEAQAQWAALVRSSPGACVRAVDLAMYRALRSDPTWGLVTQLLVTTRSYDTGLELALALLVVADRYEALRPAHEAARSPVPLYSLLLDMLDRLDEWETYLAVWHQLRRHTTDTRTYGDGPHSAATGARAAPYVMRRTPGRIHLHHLWLGSHRKDLIERKVARRRAGRRVGHLRHHPQSELSDAELRRRVSAVAAWARTVRREETDPTGADPTPGAPPPTTALVPGPTGPRSDALMRRGGA